MKLNSELTLIDIEQKFIQFLVFYDLYRIWVKVRST